MKHVTEPARCVPIVGESDVLVAGGGPAGVAAALAAARCGARTRLIESHGCLGGIWTAGLLAWMFEMDQPGIPREITGRLERRGARIGSDPNRYTYDIEQMKILLEEMCAEAGVIFQLHTRVAGVVADGHRVSCVVTESKSGREAWRASNFIDATGDGDLAALSGCGYDIGRESSGECQPMTYMALVSVRNAEDLRSCISFWRGNAIHLEAVGHFLGEIRRAGIDPSYARPTLFQVHDNLLALMINHEYGVSATNAMEITRATVRGREEVNRVVRGLRELGGAWAGMNLVATCEHIGVREGRRIHGLYTVTENDLVAGRRHEEAVCRVSFGVDVHNTNPSTGKGQEPPPVRTRPYDIPMRALIARDVQNLLLAGRCISGDFIAHSSYRVTGTAAATGQAAGVGAALSARQNQSLADLKWPEVKQALTQISGLE
ncbi:MAG: FAD-dependent oxidoreductase [Kiritimatiellia bacterium]|nr:FAD-dependent oxidoreductase [Kiritimatiellia bacterium]